MILTCPSCGSRFQIPDGALGTAGRKVKCSACQHVWFQAAEAADTEISGPPAADEAPPAVPPRPESDTEPSVEPKTGPGVAPEPPRDHPAPEISSPTERPSFVTAKADSEAETAEPDTDATDPSKIDQPTSETPVVETSAGVPADDTPDFDVNRVVGPDDDDRRSPWRRIGVSVLVVLLLAAAGAALYKWRFDVVEKFPQTLPAYAALGVIGPSSRNLKLEDVIFEVIDENGDKVLIVSGRVINKGDAPGLLPMLRGELLDPEGQVTTFWTFVAPTEILPARSEMDFRDIYLDPPVNGAETNVMVTFDDMR